MTDAKCAECESCSVSPNYLGPDLHLLEILANLEDYEMDESQHETSPLLCQEEVDKIEVYPVIHMIRSDIIVSSSLPSSDLTLRLDTTCSIS